MGFVRSVSLLAPAFVFLFSSILLAAPGPQKESYGPRLLWAFGAIRASSNPANVEPVRTKMVLLSGDKLKMMIQLKRKCFVYLIHRDSRGNFAMLFPYSAKQFDTDYRTAHNYYAPRGEAWFQLDSSTGNETFYLIASDQRLLDIEYTYEKYASSQDSEKQDMAEQMLSELGRITETYTASSGGTEKPADKESILRGFERATGADPSDIDALAAEISFDNIYSRTFVVDHR